MSSSFPSASGESPCNVADDCDPLSFATSPWEIAASLMAFSFSAFLVLTGGESASLSLELSSLEDDEELLSLSSLLSSAAESALELSLSLELLSLLLSLEEESGVFAPLDGTTVLLRLAGRALLSSEEELESSSLLLLLPDEDGVAARFLFVLVFAGVAEELGSLDFSSLLSSDVSSASTSKRAPSTSSCSESSSLSSLELSLDSLSASLSLADVVAASNELYRASSPVAGSNFVRPVFLTASFSKALLVLLYPRSFKRPAT